MTRTLVIGAGVVGLASAYELRKRGEEVVVVDRGAPGEGCSRGNAGWLVPSLGEPLAAPGLTWTSLKWMLTRDSPLHIDPLAAPSMAGWLWNFWRHCNAADYRRGCAVWGTVMAGVMRSFDALASEGVEFEMHAQGLLFVFLSADAMRHVLKAMTEAIAGVRDGLQPLGATEVRAMEPGLSARVQGGIMASGERHVRPESLSAGLARRLSGMGVTVRSGVEVTGGVRRGDRVVGVRAGPEIIEGDRVLVAAGANSGQLTDLIAGVPLPVQAGKGYSVTISAMRAPFARPLYLDEARVGCSLARWSYRGSTSAWCRAAWPRFAAPQLATSTSRSR
jgi:D-amino-acid dehydrogenase